MNGRLIRVSFLPISAQIKGLMPIPGQSRLCVALQIVRSEISVLSAQKYYNSRLFLRYAVSNFF